MRMICLASSKVLLYISRNGTFFNGSGKIIGVCKNQSFYHENEIIGHTKLGPDGQVYVAPGSSGDYVAYCSGRGQSLVASSQQQ